MKQVGHAILTLVYNLQSNAKNTRRKGYKKKPFFNIVRFACVVGAID